MGVEKVLWLVLTDPTHTLLQYTQYLICETNVIVFAICAIVMVWGKQAACEQGGHRACCPASWPRWNRQQSKINCFCLAGTTLWSHPPNREFPAPAALTQQLALSNRKKQRGRGQGGRQRWEPGAHPSSPAGPPAAASHVPQLWSLGLELVPVPGSIHNPGVASPCSHSAPCLPPLPRSTCGASTGRVRTTPEFLGGGWKDPVHHPQPWKYKALGIQSDSCKLISFPLSH